MQLVGAICGVSRDFRGSVISGFQAHHLLTGALRTGLYGSQLRILLNQRDPLNTAVNFDRIHGAYDAIWRATK